MAIVLAVAVFFVFQVYDSDLTCTAAATTALLAALNALEQRSPLKVEEGNQHECEAYVNRDDHGPVREVLFRGVERDPLVVELKVSRQ